ncbi:hypothetical protein FOL47_002501 [Perkinsus chesapeaki]|uniref:START domain-containing protein n=1 Tax=Perkinsus chesapeaki TaxID=330153 RepID=A0A7J6N063_PERCH|nr:hypothetical protein FOL47_002501 [Perkinsus chesapeaki]
MVWRLRHRHRGRGGGEVMDEPNGPTPVPNVLPRGYAATFNKYFVDGNRYSVKLKTPACVDDSPSRSFHSLCSSVAVPVQSSFVSAVSSPERSSSHPLEGPLFSSVNRSLSFLSVSPGSAGRSRLSHSPPQQQPPDECLILKEQAWQLSTQEVFGKPIENSHEFMIWRKEKECPDGSGMSMPCVKLVFQIPDIPADEVFEALSDKEWIGTWHEDVECAGDYTWSEFQFPPEGEPATGPGCERIDSKVWLTQYKLPGFAKTFGFKPREVAELRVCVKNIFGNPQMHIIAGSSIPVEHRKDCVPCTPGYERAHLFISCQLMEQTDTGTQLTMISHMDPNGVPQWVLNKIAHRKPREFCATLKVQLYKRRRQWASGRRMRRSRSSS